jgi:hypothetical protein
MRRLIIAAGIIASTITLLVSGYEYLLDNRYLCTWAPDSIALPGTRWIIETFTTSCSMFDGGMMDVIARNEATGKTATLLRIYNIEDLRISTDEGRRVVIRLPNRTYIRERHDEFDDIKVVYIFTPRDDPQDRENYLFWFLQPTDPKAIAWCRENLNFGRGCDLR